MVTVDLVNYEEYVDVCEKEKIPRALLYSLKEWEDILTEEVDEAIQGVPLGENINLPVCRNSIVYKFTCRYVGFRIVKVHFEKLIKC